MRNVYKWVPIHNVAFRYVIFLQYKMELFSREMLSINYGCHFLFLIKVKSIETIFALLQNNYISIIYKFILYIYIYLF